MATLSTPTLKQDLHPLIQRLTDTLLSHWEQYLQLSPYTLPEGVSYIEGLLDEEKLKIENRCYETPQFRKLHLELAKVGKNLDILHCVMFPRLEYNLPMFGCDLVGGRGQISAAIADLSPTMGQLSPGYLQNIPTLEADHFSQPRDLPEWGDIFSQFCLFVRPSTELDEQRFLARVSHFLTVHCQQAVAANPLSPEDQARNLAGQQYYCTQQRQNDKTRRVLEKAFGDEWAEFYMNSVLFDLPEEF
ncbi:phycocyanobilin:ferredoxin oxidoreductase [Spirulina sp. CS-785/01]|uniref:phycocyanobilin:ferredoxin oxidoreductase n=1 Tax=Spirulina sp. CS-785/01 TaxID=3021716 RepID=UPI00232DECBC|nr:phycocyanobilin:ferredoxin oxidoreductase [Spirulina sp. CS-785/01]MDB9314293.1 phycocyanobilin:ferredoxin oxidoreductase [Spirulina sp. CS-785/01]